MQAQTSLAAVDFAEDELVSGGLEGGSGAVVGPTPKTVGGDGVDEDDDGVGVGVEVEALATVGQCRFAAMQSGSAALAAVRFGTFVVSPKGARDVVPKIAGGPEDWSG